VGANLNPVSFGSTPASDEAAYRNLQDYFAQHLTAAKGAQESSSPSSGNPAFPPDADGQRLNFADSEYPEAWQRQSHCIGQCHGNNPGYPERPMTKGEKTVLLAAQLASTAWVPFMGEANAARLGAEALPFALRGGGELAGLSASRLTTGAVATATVATGTLAIQQTQQMDRADPSLSKPAPIGGGYQAANPSATAIGTQEGYQAATLPPPTFATPIQQPTPLKLATPDNPGIELPHFLTHDAIKTEPEVKVWPNGNKSIEVTGRTPAKPYTSGDLAGRFDAASGNLSLDYYNNGGIAGRGMGTALIKSAIDAAGAVKTVSGKFGLTNLKVYNALIAGGATTIEAAMGTPLGKSMQSLGYSEVTIKPAHMPEFQFKKP